MTNKTANPWRRLIVLGVLLLAYPLAVWVAYVPQGQPRTPPAVDIVVGAVTPLEDALSLELTLRSRSEQALQLERLLFQATRDDKSFLLRTLEHGDLASLLNRRVVLAPNSTLDLGRHQVPLPKGSEKMLVSARLRAGDRSVTTFNSVVVPR